VSDMGKERTEEIMRLYLGEVLGKRRFELIPDFTAADMVDHTSQLSGPAALDAHARGFCSNIPDAQIEIEIVFATDDASIGIWRWQGTPQQHMGVSADGRPIYPTRVASIFQFKNSMLSDYRPFVDAVELRNQLN
jgi:predicted ester cyclase